MMSSVHILSSCIGSRSDLYCCHFVGAKNSNNSQLKEISRPLLDARDDTKAEGIDGPEAGGEEKDADEKDASQDEGWETEEEEEGEEPHNINGGKNCC